MNNTPTPRTDAIIEQSWRNINFPNSPIPAKFARQLESELAAVTEQLKAAQDGWHDEITKGLTELRRAESIYTKAQERAERAEEQRDRLAEALQKAKAVYTPSSGGEYQTGWHDAICWVNQQALQSLNQAAVKGGADE